MDETACRAWLEAEGYGPNTVATQLSLARRLEAAYGDLAGLAAGPGRDAMAAGLSCSSADERAGRPNPSRLEIGGMLRTALASYRSAAALYRRFLAETDALPASPGAPEAGAAAAVAGAAEAAGAGAAAARPPRAGRTDTDGQRFALERDMQRALQRALRRDIAAPEPGLGMVDDGVGRAVTSGQIDIPCRDRDGAPVVVELKAGRGDARGIGQTLGYIGDLMDEEAPTPVRGIIVAEDFDTRTRAAARAVPALRPGRYRIGFRFSEADGDAP